MPKSKGDEGGFKKFLWNGDTGEFLGRTGGSWGNLRLLKSLTVAIN